MASIVGESLVKYGCCTEVYYTSGVGETLCLLTQSIGNKRNGEEIGAGSISGRFFASLPSVLIKHIFPGPQETQQPKSLTGQSFLTGQSLASRAFCLGRPPLRDSFSSHGQSSKTLTQQTSLLYYHIYGNAWKLGNTAESSYTLLHTRRLSIMNKELIGEIDLDKWIQRHGES